MPQISTRVWDQALATEVAGCEAQLWLARLTLVRLGNVLLVGQVEVAEAHIGVFNDALARANQAVDNVTAALVGSTHPRALELVAEIPILEMWLDDLLTQSVAFEAAVVAGDGPGALALLPDMHAALSDARTAVTLLAGVVDSPVVSGLRLEDLALLATVDDPVPPSVRVVREVPRYTVARIVEQVRTRVRSDAEVAANAALTAKLAEARQARTSAWGPVVARPVLGLRLAG